MYFSNLKMKNKSNRRHVTIVFTHTGHHKINFVSISVSYSEMNNTNINICPPQNMDHNSDGCRVNGDRRHNIHSVLERAQVTFDVFKLKTRTS